MLSTTPTLRPMPKDMLSLRREEEALGSQLATYERQLATELDLKASAESLAKLHTDKKARLKAQDEVVCKSN